jgi:hypothetical protein
MNYRDGLLWLFPFIIVTAGFFSSNINHFRFGRVGLYVLVFFAAFLFDLQATSFKNDVSDSVFSLIMLLMLSDLFWRIIKLKTKILRIAGVLVGLILFMAFYHDWIADGPEGLARRHSAQVVAKYKNGKHTFYLKKKQVKNDSLTEQEYALFKERGFHLLEQYCNRYPLPEGYKNAEVSFKWKKKGNITEVRIIGDKDTLWTLDSDLTPK